MVSRSRLEIRLVGPFDPRVGLVGLPAFERLGQDRQDLGRLEVADDHELAVLGSEVVVIERADLVERDLLEAIDLFVDGRHVADVVAGVLGQQALDVVEALADGIGPALLDAGDLARSSSPRTRWPAGSARGGSGGGSRGRRARLARLVSIVNVTVPRPGSRCLAASACPCAGARAGRSSCRARPGSAGGSGSWCLGSSAPAGSRLPRSGP